MRPRAFVCLSIFIVLAPAHADPPSDDALASTFRTTVAPLLERQCNGCHGGAKPKAGLDLRAFDSVDAVVRQWARWETVLEQVESGDMPPEDAKAQPTTAERAALVSWIRGVRDREAARRAGDPGVVLAHRLSNAEYDNTIRDLTSVDLRPARAFPVDPANEAGFDNTGESLQMSPALLKKYVEAAQQVAAHVLLLPRGLSFAPHPVVAETDRDKWAVRRIVDFYERQPTDLAAYFRAALRLRGGASSEKRVAAVAAEERVSASYLTRVVQLLYTPGERLGPVAALQAMFRALPTPTAHNRAAIERETARMRDLVVALRQHTKVAVPNLRVKGVNPGSQTFVLWKDRQMAAARLTYGGGALTLPPEALVAVKGTATLRLFKPPTAAAARTRYEESWKRFAAVFPDAFYVSERARVFVDAPEDKDNVGRLLSAGFHNQMGYFRDDQPLYDLVLTPEQRRELDTLWEELDFVTLAPLRQHASFIWFERSESGFLRGPEFDFARSEDKNVVSEELFGRFADVYQNKIAKATDDPVIRQAVHDHFRILNATIRTVERARLEAEPVHLQALQRFVERAYRRPLSASERDDVMAFYRELRVKAGLSHEDALRDVVASVLVSPAFLYRFELASRGDTIEPLGPYALANRLSYFLWASMPDDALFARAADGSLTRPEVLAAEARRLLRDERARGFVTEFVGHWLDSRRFESHNAVDRGAFPTFDDDLRAAMYEEPLRLALDAFQNDRSLLDLVVGDHTVLNAALARHYGLPPPTEPGAWARVDASSQGRGGLLGMAVFLTKNAPGLRTSPVKRGYWVATRILGDHIPAPPPNVPELPSDESKLGALTLREALARHREDKACAGCHARFDGFGLAFEGYGPIGERRTRDLAGHPVDARASFPGGGEGDGFAGLRQYLRARRSQDVVEQVIRKMLAFALGRSLTITDSATVTSLRQRLEANGHRASTLVLGILESPQFKHRRGESTP